MTLKLYVLPFHIFLLINYLIHSNSFFQECIPTLIAFIQSPLSTDSIHLSSLQALTNLTLLPSLHNQCVPLIRTLYATINSSYSHVLQLQSLKILVNLSSNPKMVAHLLAAKVSRFFFFDSSLTGP